MTYDLVFITSIVGYAMLKRYKRIYYVFLGLNHAYAYIIKNNSWQDSYVWHLTCRLTYTILNESH